MAKVNLFALCRRRKTSNPIKCLKVCFKKRWGKQNLQKKWKSFFAFWIPS